MIKKTIIWLLTAILWLTLSNSKADNSLFTNNKTEGDCSPIINGKVDSLKLDCSNSSIPESALKSLEMSLKYMVDERIKEMRTPVEVEDLMKDLRQEIKEWETRYHALEESIQLGLTLEPDNEKLKEAEQSLKNGDFEKAAKILEELADKQEQEVEKGKEKASDYRYRAAQSFELAFKMQAALEQLESAHKLQPNNKNYAYSYALLLQKQNQRNEAEKIYRILLENKNLDKYQKSAILHNLAFLISSDIYRTLESEKIYTQALAIRKDLAMDKTESHLINLADTLNSLGLLSSKDIKKHNEAISYFDQSLDIYNSFSKQESEEALSNKLMVLNNLGTILVQYPNEYDLAKTRFYEALEICTRLSKTNPNKYLVELSAIQNNLANLISTVLEIGLISNSDLRKSAFDEAYSLYDQSIKIRTQLSDKDPQAHLFSLSQTSNNFANLLSIEKIDIKRAEFLYREALEIRQKLSKDYPNVYLPSVAGTLYNFGILLSEQHHKYQQSLSYFEQALLIYIKLEGRAKGKYSYEISNIYLGEAQALLKYESNNSDIQYFYKKSIDLKRTLFRKDRVNYTDQLVKALSSFAEFLTSRNQAEQAISTIDEAINLIDLNKKTNLIDINNDADKKSFLLTLLAKNTKDDREICQIMNRISMIVKNRIDIKQQAGSFVLACKKIGLL